ncbi:MAG: hypothetical protein IPM51_17315 [Sphingobacteriaceae bacterium]|nr:hypothetical protein [Sphingobacteriaceae bacterium]
MKFCIGVIIFLFSPGIVAQTKNILTEFYLIDSDKKVIVNWEISSESDFQQYKLYRSVDEKNYYLVGEIPSRNISSASKYTYFEPTAGGGIIYYRLDLILKDGKQIVLGNTKIDREDKEKAITLIPHLESGTFKLISAEQIFSMELEMNDILERVYALNFVRDNTHELTVITGPIQQGPYFVTCFINGNRTTRKKIIFY